MNDSNGDFSKWQSVWQVIAIATIIIVALIILGGLTGCDPTPTPTPPPTVTATVLPTDTPERPTSTIPPVATDTSEPTGYPVATNTTEPTAYPVVTASPDPYLAPDAERGDESQGDDTTWQDWVWRAVALVVGAGLGASASNIRYRRKERARQVDETKEDVVG